MKKLLALVMIASFVLYANEQNLSVEPTTKAPVSSMPSEMSTMAPISHKAIQKYGKKKHNKKAKKHKNGKKKHGRKAKSNSVKAPRAGI